MDKQLESLWQTIRPMRVRGAMTPPLAALWETVRQAPADTLRAFRGDCHKSLDVQRGFCDTRLIPSGRRRAMGQSFVAYYRVSTKKQGQSGLGLEAQKADVALFVERAGGGSIAREFVEVESGKRADRPELTSAIAYARRAKATLLVAKLDRLARNVAFLATLMESGLEFVAVDNPHANRFTIHILAAVAEHEREMIAKRTKAALAAAKARGVALGSARPGHWAGHEESRLAGAKKGAKAAGKAHREKARKAYSDVLPLVAELQAASKSLRQIAEDLNEQGIPTRRGAKWTATQVSRLLRAGKVSTS